MVIGDEEVSSGEESTNNKKSNSSCPTQEYQASAIDPKSILLAQIRAQKEETTDNHDVQAKSKLSIAASSDSMHQIDEILKLYRKMKDVGVPLPAILHRMSRDGLSESDIRTFQQSIKVETHPNTKQIKSEDVVFSPSMQTKKLKETIIKDDSILFKYLRMTEVGIPAEAVSMKMLQEGVDESTILAFRIAHGLDSSGKNATAQLPAVPRRRSSRAMQKIHWNAIKEENLANSLWTSYDSVAAEISQKEIKQLESLFSASPRPSAKAAIGSKRGEEARIAPKQISVDPKRANNIAISLAQYRDFNSFDDLVTAVASLDESYLSVEKVNNMTSLLPTTSELDQLKQINCKSDGLGRAEQFFLAVAKMPRFAEKLNSFRYLLQFDDQMTTLKGNLTLLMKAINEVITNEKLAFICKKLLNIGNLMNESAGKSTATGITLDSLINIAKKKGSDGKTSVVDHLVSTVDDKIAFWNDIPTLRECTRLDLDEMKFSLREIKAGAKSIDDTAKAAQSLSNSQDKRVKQCAVDTLSRIIPFQKRAMCELKAMDDLVAEAESKVEALARFFAEENSTSSSIFESLLEFSRIVKESHHRKQGDMRRRDFLHRSEQANL